jgi:ABC-type phosphonate transport system ATPase subunit
MIKAHRLTKRYGEKTAVEDLSLTVRPGIVTGFLSDRRTEGSPQPRAVLSRPRPRTRPAAQETRASGRKTEAPRPSVS